MSYPDYRRCRDCGAINLHSDNIAPEVCCKRCGSQDTRLMKNEPPLWDIPESIRNKRGLYLPDSVAKCPECGDSLTADCTAWETESGRPIATAIEVHCVSEMREPLAFLPLHNWRQSDWQLVRDAVAKWCDARRDF